MKNSAVMMYFDDLAKLTAGMSKDTKFFSYMLQYMEWNSELKMNIVDMSAMRKREIISEITPESGNPLGLARQYLSRLCAQGRIKPAIYGTYSINPNLYGYSRYVAKDIRKRAGEVFEKTTYHSDGTVTKESYFVDEDDGEKVELT